MLKSELAAKLAERDPARAVAEIRDVERISREALIEVRKAVRGYRSEGLPDAVANAERVLVAAGITPEIAVDPRPPSARRGAGPGLSRCARPSPTWSATPARRNAGFAWPTTAARTTSKCATTAGAGLAPEGSGLSGMRERLRQVAGTLERDGQQGTRLLMTLPAATGALVIRVLLAEDQAMVLGALSALLDIESRSRSGRSGASGTEALELATDAAARRRRHRHRDARPVGARAGRRTEAARQHGAHLILTTFARPGYLRRALDAGASGYLLKDAPSHRLADAIRRVHGGGRAVDPELAAEAWSERTR